MNSELEGRLAGRTLGGFRLTELLGVGGMAEVYRGEDIQLGRAVAIKVLAPMKADEADYVRRFREEARHVAALDHPNIVPVYHFDEQDGLLFLVMPLLDESLRQRMERGGLLPIGDAVRATTQIAAALDAAHARGIVHRDVKPENILLNAEGNALLTDFGIAREVQPNTREIRPSRTLSEIGLPIGTPEFMAPEQLRMAAADGRADIYGLGAVLYELLTGHTPHEAATPLEVAALTLSAPVMPPSIHNPAVWPELDAVVLTALAYEPSDRFPDAHHFAEALRDAMAVRGERASMPPAVAVDWQGSAAGVSPPLPGSLAGGDADTLGAATVGGTQPSGGNVPGSRAIGDWIAVPPAVWLPAQWLPAPTEHRRGRGAYVALLIVAMLAVAGGGALLVANHLPGSPLGAQGPIGTTSVPGATVTHGLPGTPGTTGLPATGIPQTPRATSTATLTPTAGPTATPSPPNVSVPQLFATGHTRCMGSQTITNKGSTDIKWAWTKVQPGLPGDFRWELGTGGTPGNVQPPLPNASDLAPGASATITIAINCDTKDHQWTITFSASDVSYPSQSLTQTFTNWIDVHGY